MCTALTPISISCLACSMSLAYGFLARSLCDQVWLPIVMPAAASALESSGAQVACSPISKNVALVQLSCSALSTIGVLPGHGPSSKVSNTSLSRRKSYCLKCSVPKAGPPVVSIWTMRDRPIALGLLQAGMVVAKAAPVLAAVGAGAAAEGELDEVVAFCARTVGAGGGGATLS